VLSSYAAARPCSRKVVDPTGATYCYLQATSMASPMWHVSPALILNQVGSAATPGAVQAIIRTTADAIACPMDTSPYSFFPAIDNGAPETCQGGIGSN